MLHKDCTAPVGNGTGLPTHMYTWSPPSRRPPATTLCCYIDASTSYLPVVNAAYSPKKQYSSKNGQVAVPVPCTRNPPFIEAAPHQCQQRTCCAAKASCCLGAAVQFHPAGLRASRWRKLATLLLCSAAAVAAAATAQTAQRCVCRVR